MESMKTCVMFDLDGTLLDTLEDIGEAINVVLTSNGYPTHSLNDYRNFVGNGMRDLVKKSLPIDVLDTDFFRIFSEAKETYQKKYTNKTAPYHGIGNTLHSLMKEQVTIMVLSNKPDVMTVNLVAHYFPDVFFADVRGLKDGAQAKPSPVVPLEMLRSKGISPQHCAYVGDTSIDIQTAKASGMVSVGVSWGFRPQELLTSNADYIIDEAKDLLPIATALASR